jgi:hypothetical protein
MDRRRFLVTSLASALGAPLAEAQHAGKVARTGFLGGGTAGLRGDTTAFRDLQGIWSASTSISS